MYSKRTWRVCGEQAIRLLMLFVLALTGCARENTPSSPPIVIALKPGGNQCLTDAGDEVARYIDGRMSATELTAFWDCLSGAISDFQRLTHGDQGDDYSPEALRAFLENYFIRDRQVSDTLLSSVMELKRVFLGGTTAVVTRAELKNLQQLLNLLRGISLNLQPHAPLLFFAKTQATDQDIATANAVFAASLKQIGAWLDGQKQSYSFSQVAQLLAGLDGWITGGGAAPSLWIVKSVQALAFVPDIKTLVIGGDPAQIGAGEWSAFATALATAFASYTEFIYSFNDGLENGLARPGLAVAANGIADLLEQGLSRHPGAGLSVSDWHSLFVDLVGTGWLASDYKVESFDQVLAWFLARPLGNGQSGATAFTNAHLKRLRVPLGQWLSLQQLAAADPDLSANFNSVLAASAPLEWDKEGREIFRVPAPTTWSDANRRHMIFPYVLMRWLKESYTDLPVDYITQAQMDLAVKEILPLLHDFGLLLANDESISSQRFREADLFTLSSNGNNLVDLGEAARYMELITSAYEASDNWLKKADASCPTRDVDCVRVAGLTHAADVFASVPRLNALLPSWGSARFLAYMQNDETTVLGHPPTSPYQVGDLLQVFQLFEYVEVFMQRFDADHSEIISTPEALNAYPVFGPTINQLFAGGHAPNDMVLGLFTFMLKYGNTPDKLFGGYLEYVQWLMTRNSWQLSTERDTLMSLLAQLSKR